MSVRLFTKMWLLLLLVLASASAHAQGFAGLGTNSEGYAQVTPGKLFSFPQDHGPHPDYRIEWWYVTANLTDADGNPHGIQWTLFRQTMTPGTEESGWNDGQVWLGHAALSSQGRHLSAETVARGNTGQAGVTTAPFAAWLDDWSLTSTAPAEADADKDAFSAMRLTASDESFRYDLTLTTNKPLVFQGEAGFSQKSEAGQASYYYSQPFFEVAGDITVGDETLTVTGNAWLDREWSSQPLTGTQTGWDWFSLHLDGGEKLMMFRLRDETAGDYFSGTWIGSDGAVTPLGPNSIRMTPLTTAQVAGREMPIGWRLEVPDKGLDIQTQALNADSWMQTSIPYWEGPIGFEGSHAGVGYLEMTGY
ncbi:MAG: lipocalin-like domain-containing protein [Alphaproteobacteria bacterium]